MVRHVFFSFHYDNDKWRANQVRNSWVTQEDQEAAGFIDSADWEDLKQEGEDAVFDWIDDQLEGTSVTAVLIGSDTYGRKYIDYEIEESAKRGNGILGIYVHNLEDENKNTTSKGTNPLSKWHYTDPREEFTDVWNTYYWIADDGYENLGNWVEEAKQIADRR